MTIKILRSVKLYLAFTCSFFLSISANNVHAVFIDFDDLTYVPEYPEWPHFADTPIADQYASQGLSVIDGFLAPYNFFNPDAELGPNDISGPNYLLGGISLTLHFLGEKLPTYVGMYVGSPQEAIFLEAYGTSGLLASAHTIGPGMPTWETPSTPRQYISFELAEGITSIQMWGSRGSRVSAHVDDLTFTYADVPEPSPLILMCLGVFAIFYKRVSLQKTSNES
jgi:hypothetical protein